MSARGLAGGPRREAGAASGLRRGAVAFALRRGARAVAFALCLGLPAPAAAQGAGSAASTVLRLAPAPRGLALGNALAAVADPFAAEYNPALPARGAGGAAAAFQALPVDASAGAAVAAFAVPGGAAAVSLRFVDYGEIDVYEESGGGPVGEPTGATATAGELTALAAYALALGPVRLGVGARWLRLEVAGLRDDAVAADAGALIEPTRWLAVGAAVQGLGGDVEAGRPAPLPRTVRLGARVRREVGPVAALLAVEARSREERTGLGAGLELGIGAERLAARARVGYESRAAAGDAYSRLVFGGGVRLDRVAVDFAYRALGPLGATRQLGVSFGF